MAVLRRTRDSGEGGGEKEGRDRKAEVGQWSRVGQLRRLLSWRPLHPSPALLPTPRSRHPPPTRAPSRLLSFLPTVASCSPLYYAHLIKHLVYPSISLSPSTPLASALVKMCAVHTARTAQPVEIETYGLAHHLSRVSRTALITAWPIIQWSRGPLPIAPRILPILDTGAHVYPERSSEPGPVTRN